MDELPILYTATDAAKVLSVSRSQIYVLLKNGDLGSIRIGRSRRIAQKHMSQYIDQLMGV